MKEVDFNKNVDFKEVQKKAKTTFSDFKAFATKGNIIDMAVGVIIGSAFTKIVTSLVNDIVTPLISILTGKVDFSNLFFALDGKSYATLEEATTAGASVFNYGNFFTAIIDFLIIAFALFLFMRQLLRFKKKEEPAPVTTKECPYCKTQININATRCPNCTSLIPEKVEEK